MTEPALRGVCPIIATPFTESGEVDYESLRNEVQTLAQGGCHAAALFGVVSEFFKLTDAERERMVAVVADETDRHDLPLVLSVTHDSTEIAVQWAREYENAGADFLMVFPPSFLQPPSDGIADHLRAIGEAVDIPIMVQYRQPENPPMSPETLAAIGREANNIDYFKIETPNTGPFISALLKEAPEVDALVGRAGYQMIDVYERGGIGVIPAASLFEIYVAIHELFFDGKKEKAMSIHDQLIPLLNQVSEASIPFEKALLAKRGIIETGYCRKPTEAIPDAQQEMLLERHYENMKPLLRECQSVIEQTTAGGG